MNDLSALYTDNITTIVLLLVISAGILFLLFHDWNTARRKAKHAKPTSCCDFLEQWDTYRKNDTSGCYIILIYKRKPRQSTVHKCKRYENIYIGQSVNMYKRVHNHLTGHGNGDVYADVKYGRHVYMKFIPCDITQLNEFEIRLIEEYNATQSYNRTKGGAKVTAR